MSTKSKNSTKTDNGTKSTYNHDEIREWVEARKGKPATVAGTASKGADAGLLRIDFPKGASNPPLEPLNWEEFFEKFDAENLAMIYQESGPDGGQSYFCKFVRRED